MHNVNKSGFGPLVCLLGGLIAIEFLFVLLDLYINWLRWSNSGSIRRMFNITREDGLASLFAVMQTFAVAGVVWLIYLSYRTINQQRWKNLAWLVLAMFFTFMAIDDGALVHERIGSAYEAANSDQQFNSYAWQYVVAPFYILMGAFVFLFLWFQPIGDIKRGWLFAAFFLLSLAMGIDFIEGIDNGYARLTELTGWRTKLISHFSKAIEEFLEMAGMTLLLGTFLNYLGNLTTRVEIRIKNRRVSFVPADRSALD